MKNKTIFDQFALVIALSNIVTPIILIIALVFNPGNAALYGMLIIDIIILLVHGPSSYLKR
jgi:hypothetical protein